MEFLNPKKRRQHRQKLFIGYGLIAIALTMLTIIIYFAAYGFDVDHRTGQVIQNGMIIVNAAPEPARITVNGNDEGTTDKRLSLPAGQYNVKLTRDGYRDWQKDVDLMGSAIEQLVYPFMFPSTLSTKSIQDYSARPSMMTQSPDRRWLVLQKPGDPSNSFQVVDLNDEENPATTVVFPDGIITTGTTHSFSPVEWSTNNDDLLLKHVVDGKTEFVVFNHASPQKSRNLTTLFEARPFTSVTFRDRNPDLFYLYNASDKALYSTDSKARQYTLLAKDVLSYKGYQKDLVVYMSPAKDTNKADVHFLYKGTDKVVRQVLASPVYTHDVADFDGSLYVAVGASNDKAVYILKDPLDSFSKTSDPPQSFRALALQGVTSLSFSTNARFVAAQAGDKFAVYDAETDRQYHYDIDAKLTAKSVATWMDGHRLSIIPADGKVRVFDFDGINLQTLNAGVAGTTVYFNRDYDALFTLAPKEKAFSLNRTELRLNP